MQSVCGFHLFRKGVRKGYWEALWQVLRMYNVGSKLLIGINSTYVDSSACVKVKWGKSEWCRIDRE